jgi:hypothetical protein
MGSNRIGPLVGQAAWVILFFMGVAQFVDPGFGPIIICPGCVGWLKAALGVVSIGVSVAAFYTNRATADRVTAGGR